MLAASTSDRHARRRLNRSNTSLPAVSGWTTEGGTGPTEGMRMPRRATDVRACAKSTSFRFRSRGTRRAEARRDSSVNETSRIAREAGRERRRRDARGSLREADTRRSRSESGTHLRHERGHALALGRPRAHAGAAACELRRQRLNDFFLLHL